MIRRAILKGAHFVLTKMDAEFAHILTLSFMAKTPLWLLPRYKITAVDQILLKTKVLGMDFINPVGLAAGFDKNADMILPMCHFGFGFVEVGTVTPKAQEGNPRPRIFRCPEHMSIINRMGFPNKGIHHFKNSLDHFLKKQKSKPIQLPNSMLSDHIIGVNIGMNKDQTDPLWDYKILLGLFSDRANYIAINISSPNTPGLRGLQKPENLRPLLKELIDLRDATSSTNQRVPILIKLAPDMELQQLYQILDIALDLKLDGVILTNTTLDRPDSLPTDFAGQAGGLSGRYLKEKAQYFIAAAYVYTKGKIPFIGVGGIENGHDAYVRLRAGASLVQLYTSFAYRGPVLLQQINQEIAANMRRDGFKTINEFVGIDADAIVQHHTQHG